MVEAPLGDLLTGDHALVVLAPDSDTGSGEAVDVAACGEIGGVRSANAPLAVGLRERGGSGVAGIASLAPDQADDDRTRVSVFVAPRLAKADEN